QQHHCQRKDKIELLLDAERPQMKERQLLGGPGKITGLRPEEEVRREQSRGDHAFGERLRLRRQHEHERADRRRGKDDEQRGQKPPGAALVEVEKIEARRRCDQTGNQKSGYDEENINAEISAAEPKNVSMKEKHGDDGTAAQSVNIRPIAIPHAICLARRARPSTPLPPGLAEVSPASSALMISSYKTSHQVLRAEIKSRSGPSRWG